MNDRQRYQRDRASVMAMIKFILMVGIIALLCWLGTKIFVVLVPFLVGFLLAKTSFAIANPIARRISGGSDPAKLKPNQTKSTKTKTALVVYIILNVILVIIVIALCLALISQVNSLLKGLSGLASGLTIDNISKFIEKFSTDNGGFLTEEMLVQAKTSAFDILTQIIAKIPQFVQSLISGIWGMFNNLPYAIFTVVSIILSGFYFINDGPQVLRFYVKNIPSKKFRNRTFFLINDLFVLLFRVLGGYFVLLMITSVEATVVFALAGIPELSIILGLLTGVIDFLPVLGASVVMLPVAAYCIANGNIVGAVVIVIGLGIMTIIRRVVEPPILGKSMQMHPLVTLISMAAGVAIWGLGGFLLGPALAIIIAQIIKVFKIDKQVMNYISNVLERLMKDPEPDKVSDQDAQK